jgi:hypothetical protein
MSIYGWKIATTEAGLATGSMRSLGLRKLQTAPYRDHTQVVPQGDGGEAEDGFKELNLVFRNVTRMAAAQLQELIDIALAGSGLIYLTVDRNNATAARTGLGPMRPHPLTPASRRPIPRLSFPVAT